MARWDGWTGPGGESVAVEGERVHVECSGLLKPRDAVAFAERVVQAASEAEHRQRQRRREEPTVPIRTGET